MGDTTLQLPVKTQVGSDTFLPKHHKKRGMTDLLQK